MGEFGGGFEGVLRVAGSHDGDEEIRAVALQDVELDAGVGDVEGDGPGSEAFDFCDGGTG